MHRLPHRVQRLRQMYPSHDRQEDEEQRDTDRRNVQPAAATLDQVGEDEEEKVDEQGGSESRPAQLLHVLVEDRAAHEIGRASCRERV